MLTSEILAASSRQAARPLSVEDIATSYISSVSRWCDPRWIFDNPTPGSTPGASTIYWGAPLPDGTLLTDVKHTITLDWLKRFAWSLLTSPGDNLDLGPGSMGTIGSSLRRFATWLVKCDYRLPAELGTVAMASFLSDVPSLFLSGSGNNELVEDVAEYEDDISDFDNDVSDTEGLEESLSINAVQNLVRIPILLWKQREALLAVGVQPMPEAPFGGKSAYEISNSIAVRVRGWTHPLPDEVCIPIVNKAAWFIGQPAEDVIELQASFLEARDDFYVNVRPGLTSIVGKNKASESHVTIAKDFRFSTLSGEKAPWHVRLKYLSDISANNKPLFNRVRQLVQAVIDAAVIVVQSTGGMRISEICALPAGISVDSGLPVCIRVEDSFTQLNEIFICQTLLSKTEETPRNQDWIVGMRPKGSAEIPLAVQAIIILNKILAPYRKTTKNDRLLITLSSSGTLPSINASPLVTTGTHLRLRVKSFVAEWVDLSGLPDESARAVEDNDLVKWRESKGRVIKTTHFRKMWASFALGVDQRLLPVIQMHFHHLSQVVTEDSYIGRNRVQVAPLSTVRAQQTNLLMFEMATGKSLSAGRMSDQVSQNIERLRSRVQGASKAEAWRETVLFVNEFDLRLRFASHGDCLPLVPLSMRCHQVAGTSSWLNREPNYSAREPTICVGCSCFMVDKRHQGFWENRYVENQAAYLIAERAGHALLYRVVRERAHQARALLLRLGLDIAPLDVEVAARLREAKRGP